MKRIVLFIVLLTFASKWTAQITFNAAYNSVLELSLDKFHLSGYKYVKRDIANLKIEIYNINHTLFKTINIPPQTAPVHSIDYVSENLFDTDNLMEYALTTYTSSGGPFGVSRYKFFIYKENGTQMMVRDSAKLTDQSLSTIFENTEGIFFDGTQTKMRLSIQSPNSFSSFLKTEIYTLPGSIPCSECSSKGPVSGIATPNNPGENNPVFYPNPVTDQLKLKYDLSKDYKNAEIKIYDLQGKLVETFKVTNTFDFIYLPSDYNNGLYLYQLNVDGNIVKTEKIILNR